MRLRTRLSFITDAALDHPIVELVVEDEASSITLAEFRLGPEEFVNLMAGRYAYAEPRQVVTAEQVQHLGKTLKAKTIYIPAEVFVGVPYGDQQLAADKFVRDMVEATPLLDHGFASHGNQGWRAVLRWYEEGE